MTRLPCSPGGPAVPRRLTQTAGESVHIPGGKAGVWAEGLRKAEDELRASNQGFHRRAGPGRAGLGRAGPLGPVWRGCGTATVLRVAVVASPPTIRQATLGFRGAGSCGDDVRRRCCAFPTPPTSWQRAPQQGGSDGGALMCSKGTKRPPAVPPHHCRFLQFTPFH